MYLDLRIGNCDTGFVEGEFDIFCQREFGGEVVAGFRPGTNCQIHAIVGQFEYAHQWRIVFQYSFFFLPARTR